MKVKITDLTLRDAHQSLIATRLRIEDMLPILDEMNKANFYSMEVWGGATFDACIRYLNEDPWERLRILRKKLPDVKLQMLLRGQNILGYKHYPDDIVEKFIEKAAENGIDIFRIFDALNDLRNLKTSIKTVKKLKKHAQAAISYTTSPIHNIEMYVSLAKELEDMGADSICIKDMAGLLLPYDAYKLVKKIKEIVSIPVAVHSHATTATSVATLIKAVEAGADIIDTAISSFSMQTSHSPTETIIACLKGTEFDPELDLSILNRIADHFKIVRKKYSQYETSTIVNTKILMYQVPGGMLSNLESQLKNQNAFDKLDQVLEEIKVVRKDFGYPPLVTPTSQIVGTQAVINVLSGKRYSTLTAESKNLLVGKYGKTPGDVNGELMKRALKELGLEHPITSRPADYLKPAFSYFKDKLKSLMNWKKVKDEDVLTYALFPNVAPQFFENRNKKVSGKKTVIKKVEDKGKIKIYIVNVNGKNFKVTVQPDREVYIETEEDVKPKVETATCEKLIIKSPVAGTVIKLKFSNDEKVKEGDVLMILEAMKVEFEIKATKSGTVKYLVREHENVQVDSPLCEIM